MVHSRIKAETLQCVDVNCTTLQWWSNHASKSSEIEQPGLDNLHNWHYIPTIHIHTLEHETMHIYKYNPPFLSCGRNACFCLHRRSAFAAEKGAEVWIKVYSGLGQLGTKKINYIATIMPGLKSECTRLLHLVLHASECRSAHCLHANCRKVKGLFVHGTICRTRAASGCIWCKKMWYILQLHALACRESECRVPRCKDLKQYLWKCSGSMNLGRAAAVMEMVRRGELLKLQVTPTEQFVQENGSNTKMNWNEISTCNQCKSEKGDMHSKLAAWK